MPVKSTTEAGTPGRADAEHECEVRDEPVVGAEDRGAERAGEPSSAACGEAADDLAVDALVGRHRRRAHRGRSRTASGPRRAARGRARRSSRTGGPARRAAACAGRHAGCRCRRRRGARASAPRGGPRPRRARAGSRAPRRRGARRARGRPLPPPARRPGIGAISPGRQRSPSARRPSAPHPTRESRTLARSLPLRHVAAAVRGRQPPYRRGTRHPPDSPGLAAFRSAEGPGVRTPAVP